ncbi:hypothetical protein GIB67_029062, partial [Kingdonia uniflora]
DLTMSPEEEEYTESSDEEEEYDECKARVGFKCRSILAKLREIYLRLIKYHCYEYCQIGHHILIDNRLDDFYPKMLAWQTTKQKFTRNKAKHHLALMRQQLDLRTINNIQWDPFKNMKDALKREVVIAGNISHKRVLLQCSFGGYEWYLGDRCWAQLEHRAVTYDPPEKLYYFMTDNLVTSLREAGWIKTQHYIVGHHVDYDAYWRHVSHGALMSDIARWGNIDIPGPGALTGGVTFPHVEFPLQIFLLRRHKSFPHSLVITLDGLWS